MADKIVPYIVRRARLLTGMTQSEFTLLYGVDEATVSRWETGSAQPSPEIWSRLRNISLRASSALDEALVKASPVWKCIANMENLTHPIAVSKGVEEAIEAVGASKVRDQHLDVAEVARNSPDYGISGLRALEIVQADRRWVRGDIIYAEAH
ncbi:MAG: helix-turn-helix domain-containing protein [Rhodomicrobium sp.]